MILSNCVILATHFCYSYSMWDFIYMYILNNFSLTCEFLSFYAPRTSSTSSPLPMTFFHYQNVIHGPSLHHQQEPCVNLACSSMGTSLYIPVHWNYEFHHVLAHHWQHSFVGNFSTSFVWALLACFVLSGEVILKTSPLSLHTTLNFDTICS